MTLGVWGHRPPLGPSPALTCAVPTARGTGRTSSWVPFLLESHSGQPHFQHNNFDQVLTTACLRVIENPFQTLSALANHESKALVESTNKRWLLKYLNMTDGALEGCSLCLVQVYVISIHVDIRSCFFNLCILFRIMILLSSSINEIDL